MLKKISLFIFRTILLVGCISLLYFLIPYKIAEIQVESANESPNQKEANVRALYWNSDSSKALINLAELSKAQGDFEKAKNFALEVLNIDPTNGQAMSILVSAYEQLSDAFNIEKALNLAPKLWASHSYVHITLADYWSRKGNIIKVLSEWDLLITRHRALYKPIFPILQTYASSENSRSVLIPYASQPASWWNDFFSYMAKNKVSLSVLDFFYELRMKNDSPLEENERNAYVKRLQHDGLWKRSYTVWNSGLDVKQLSLAGLLFDGGFESRQHDTAYDWHFNQSRQAKITLGRTRGMSGKRALHIVFNKRKAIRFKHVWQQLLLDPKQTYSVSMKTRIDSLKNPEGLVWKIICGDSKKQVIAESEALLGRKQWYETSFDFTVPKTGCETQIIRLEAVSEFHHEQFFKGGIWFDQLDISLLSLKSVE